MGFGTDKANPTSARSAQNSPPGLRATSRPDGANGSSERWPVAPTASQGVSTEGVQITPG